MNNQEEYREQVLMGLAHGAASEYVVWEGRGDEFIAYVEKNHGELLQKVLDGEEDIVQLRLACNLSPFPVI